MLDDHPTVIAALVDRDLLPCPRRQVEVDIPSHPRQIGTFGALGWMELSTLPWIVGSCWVCTSWSRSRVGDPVIPSSVRQPNFCLTSTRVYTLRLYAWKLELLSEVRLLVPRSRSGLVRLVYLVSE